MSQLQEEKSRLQEELAALRDPDPQTTAAQLQNQVLRRWGKRAPARETGRVTPLDRASKN